MAARELGSELFLPDKLFWIIGPSYQLAEKEFRVLWDDIIVRMGLGKNRALKRGYDLRNGDMFLQFPWNTRIEVKSAKYPEYLVGEMLDGAIMSEAAKQNQEVWERFIRPALADHRGWAIFPTTPEGKNWLYRTMWLLGSQAYRDEYPDYESWRFPSWDNPYLFPGGVDDPEIVQMRKTMAPEFFAQEIEADFTSFVGKIYSEWDDEIHIRKHKFNPLWKNYITFDWGFANPLAAVEFQVSPWDSVHVWREHYLSHHTLPQHLAILAQREQPEGYHLDMTFGDCADPEAVETVRELFAPCLSDQRAKENWREGVDLFKSFLECDREVGTDDFGAPILEPGYFVDPSCTNHIREIDNYRTKEPPPKGTNVPEMGRNIEDHTLDAMRYALMHLFVIGANMHVDKGFWSQGIHNDVLKPVGTSEEPKVGETIFRLNSSPVDTGASRRETYGTIFNRDGDQPW